jgi:hypothetical protein
MTAGRLRVVWYLLIAQPVRHDWRIPAKMARAVASRVLRASGARWTCSRITRMNAASLGAHRRLGAVTIGHALFLCGRRRQVTIASRAFLHFSRGADAAPRLHVQPPYTAATPTDATPTTTRALP